MTTDREVLAELVALKDLKERYTDHAAIGAGLAKHRVMVAEYLARKPLAWAAARARLALPEAVPFVLTQGEEVAVTRALLKSGKVLDEPSQSKDDLTEARDDERKELADRAKQLVLALDDRRGTWGDARRQDIYDAIDALAAPQINASAPDSLKETDFERGYIKGVIEVGTDASKLAILLQMVLDDIKVCRSEHAENGTDWKPIDLSTETVEALDAAYAEALTRKPMPIDDGFRIRRDESGEIVFVPTVEQAISDFAVAQNRMGQRLAYALRSINPTQRTEGIDLTNTDEGKACRAAYIALKAAIADQINAPAGTPALPSERPHE